MRLDAEKQCYVRCTKASEIKVGVGYWIYLDGEDPVSFEPDEAQTSWQTAGLGNGWSLVGVANGSNWQSQASAIWQWQNGGFQKIALEKLVAGKAYFAKP